MACTKPAKKKPSARERLSLDVINGRKTSRQSVRRDRGLQSTANQDMRRSNYESLPEMLIGVGWGSVESNWGMISRLIGGKNIRKPESESRDLILQKHMTLSPEKCAVKSKAVFEICRDELTACHSKFPHIYNISIFNWLTNFTLPAKDSISHLSILWPSTCSFHYYEKLRFSSLVNTLP